MSQLGNDRTWIENPGRYGVYVHLPFCRTRCPYCDFVSGTGTQPSHAEYLAAVKEEWLLRQPLVRSLELSSIYIGGGTPSLFDGADLASLIGCLSDGDLPEITVEVNPGDSDESWLKMFVDSGGRRVSIGAQAFDDQRLALLGRRHDLEMTQRTIDLCRQVGVPSIGVDFIYGTPGHDMAQLQRELSCLIGMGVDHVSAYELTIASGTEWGRQVEEGVFRTLDDDILADFWNEICEQLESSGLKGYEVSNYARSGHRCIHNENYWAGGRYVALGAAAHGFVLDSSQRRVRYSNTVDSKLYVKLAGKLESPANPVGKGILERTDEETYARELIMLALRTKRGVRLITLLEHLTEFEARRWSRIVDSMTALGNVTLSEGWLRPTFRGMMMADEIASSFF